LIFSTPSLRLAFVGVDQRVVAAAQGGYADARAGQVLLDLLAALGAQTAEFQAAAAELQDQLGLLLQGLAGDFVFLAAQFQDGFALGRVGGLEDLPACAQAGRGAGGHEGGLQELASIHTAAPSLEWVRCSIRAILRA
jgi:hypothetical protein